MNSLDSALLGVRVVSLATNIPGPLAAARLRAMGAAVTKIEPPSGDALALACRRWYDELCAGQEVLRLDLRSDDARAALNERLCAADLLITTMRGSSLERIGLGWSTLHERYPRLSHVAVVGEAAPNDSRAGHDLTYQAQAGLLAPPAMPRSVFADLAAAERAVSYAIAAIVQRDRTGCGVRAEVAIVDAARELGVPVRHGLCTREGALGGGFAPYALYRASDGWIAVAALEAHFLTRLRELLGIDVLDASALEGAFLQRSVTEWQRLAQQRDLPLAIVESEGA
jgi:alpha-methylacyl-CoA racemase